MSLFPFHAKPGPIRPWVPRRRQDEPRRAKTAPRLNNKLKDIENNIVKPMLFLLANCRLSPCSVVISPRPQPNLLLGRIILEGSTKYTILNTPMTHQGGLADRRRPTRANHRQTTLGKQPRISQSAIVLGLWGQTSMAYFGNWQGLGMNLERK